MKGTHKIIVGDVLNGLATIGAGTIQSCVTSPPYWGLRRYGSDPAELGQEPTPETYVARLVEVFREVRRVLRDDGTLWLNIGDSYSNDTKWGGTSGGKNYTSAAGGYQGQRVRRGKDCDPKRGDAAPGQPMHHGHSGCKPKDLVGVPWMLAFALRADGWWLRADNVWGKPNGMPESVKDRPGRAHEYVFLLSKSQHYQYDHRAVRTAPNASTVTRLAHDSNAARKARASEHQKRHPDSTVNGIRPDKQRGHSRRHAGFNDRWDEMEKQQQQDGSNLRSVWWIPPAQFSEAHFAVMPERVAEICVLAGCLEGGTVLDPFCGSGTVGVVACPMGRHFVGCELYPHYAAMAEDRIGRALWPNTYRDESKDPDSPLFSCSTQETP